jgi:phospholipid/cholesterol/gamma-HCH transport system permease protein
MPNLPARPHPDAADALAPAPARAGWRHEADTAVLQLSGDWRGGAQAALATLAALSPPGQTLQRLRLDTRELLAWDADLAPALWPLLLPLHRHGVALELTALPAALRTALELALSADLALPAPPSRHRRPWQRVFGVLGAALSEARISITFVGEVLLAAGRVAGQLLRPGHGHTAEPRVMRGADLWRQVDRCGPMSLPIVALTSCLIGLMLAYMGGAQLERIGGQSFIADVVAVGMVRELAGLTTGVILAGRLGAAFAAELATMQSNQEIDALRALGIDPIEHLVLPRVVAMLLVAPLLVALAGLLGTLAGLPVAVGIYGVPAAEYLHKALQAMTYTHLWAGMAKGVLYMLLIGLAGCRHGLSADRNAQAVGEATTTAVVKSLVWIVVAASATTVLFQSLGL